MPWEIPFVIAAIAIAAIFLTRAIIQKIQRARKERQTRAMFKEQVHLHEVEAVPTSVHNVRWCECKNGLRKIEVLEAYIGDPHGHLLLRLTSGSQRALSIASIFRMYADGPMRLVFNGAQELQTCCIHSMSLLRTVCQEYVIGRWAYTDVRDNEEGTELLLHATGYARKVNDAAGESHPLVVKGVRAAKLRYETVLEYAGEEIRAITWHEGSLSFPTYISRSAVYLGKEMHDTAIHMAERVVKIAVEYRKISESRPRRRDAEALIRKQLQSLAMEPLQVECLCGDRPYELTIWLQFRHAGLDQPENFGGYFNFQLNWEEPVQSAVSDEHTEAVSVARDVVIAALVDPLLAEKRAAESGTEIRDLRILETDHSRTVGDSKVIGKARLLFFYELIDQGSCAIIQLQIGDGLGRIFAAVWDHAAQTLVPFHDVPESELFDSNSPVGEAYTALSQKLREALQLRRDLQEGTPLQNLEGREFTHDSQTMALTKITFTIRHARWQDFDRDALWVEIALTRQNTLVPYAVVSLMILRVQRSPWEQQYVADWRDRVLCGELTAERMRTLLWKARVAIAMG